MRHNVLACMSLFGLASALELPFKRAPRGTSFTMPFRIHGFSSALSTSSSDSNDTVSNVNDVRYVTNITINGVEVPVALDTGSTDLWVIPPGGIGEFNDTGIPIKLYYGDGSYGTQGTIGVSPFSMGPYNIERQAFMNAELSTIKGLQDQGVYGILGLSFDFITASPINLAIKKIYGPDTTWGRSVLRNLFAQDPTQPNFIGLNLARTGDLEDISGGSFMIGEYDQRYTEVESKPKLAQFPKGGDRWTTLLEGIFVDGKAVAIGSTVPGVPGGQAQVMLDTGDPNSIFPLIVLDGIYSRIPGAALYDDQAGTRLWIVPCNTTAHVELMFGSEKYLIHPLDLTTITDPIKVNGEEHTACVSSFMGADNWGEGDFDISLGDTFLRNVYSIFDFGDTLPDGSDGEPYMQLLSKINSTKADAQVASIRGTTMASLPSEIDPAALVVALLGPNAPTPTIIDSPPVATHSPTTTEIDVPSTVPVTGESSSTTSVDVPSSTDSDSSKPEPTDVGGATGFNGKTLVSDKNSASTTTVEVEDPLVRRYGPIIIALLVGNMLVTLALAVFAVMSWIRRGSPKAKANRAMIDPVYTPVKNTADYRDEEASNPYTRPYGQ